MPEFLDSWLFTAVSDFGRSCKTKLAGAGGAEAAIRSPLEGLLKAVGDHHSIPEVTWHDEVRVPELGVRPDYAVQVNGLVNGYIEIKRPGLSVDPDGFTGRNKIQWERLRDLPNLLYTNGTEWRLFRDGVQLGQTVWFVGTLKASGERLRPAEAAAFDALLKTFLLWTPPPIRNVARLVQHIAPLCRLLRAAVLEQLSAEAKSDAPEDDTRARPFTGLRSDWRKLLFPEADNATFADGYAQTVTFALLLACTEDIPLTEGGLHEVGRRLNADHALMGSALQLLTDNINKRFSVTLKLLTHTVACVDWPAIRAGNQDAYLHLYENFLTRYDPALRQKSGSYYTPREIVEEMVRLAEDVLRTRLGKEHGYAEHDVRIVDPAMGTGTFLHTIIERVAKHAVERSGDGMASDAVAQLVERLYGFELQMNPYAVAELRASDLLRAKEVPLPAGGLNLFLTDTLETPFVDEQEPLFAYGALSTSRRRANQIKGEVPVTVVIGNPPYDDKAQGRGGWVEKPSKGQEKPLLDAFRYPGNGRYEHVLKNMYVYFWRWATWKVFDAHEAGGPGVVCFITPSGFATGPGGRGLRDYLRRTCDEGWVINLSPEGQRADVATRAFPAVAQPLGIYIFLRRVRDADHSHPARIHYRSIAGRRVDKFRQLAQIAIDDDGWRETHTTWERPFTPTTQSGWEDFPALDDLFPWGSPGIKTNRSWVSAPSTETLRRRWARLIREDDPTEKARLFKVTRDRTLHRMMPPLPGRPARRLPIGQETSLTPQLVRVGLRSFDRQWLIDDNRVLDFPRPDLWSASRDGQIFLNQQSSHEIESGPAVVVTALIPDTHHFNGRGGRIMPILHPDGTANVPSGLLQYLADALRVAKVTVLDLAAYVVAVAGHSTFTEQFAEELLTPGVRVPLTRNPESWRKAVGIGTEVLWTSTYGERCADQADGRPACDVRFARTDTRQIRYLTNIGTTVPGSLRHEAETNTLYVGEGAFNPVPQDVFTFDVGGRQVICKWFGYRKANPTSKKTSPLDDIHVDTWPREWTNELIELLSVLRRLVDLVPVQRDLLAEVLAGPMVTQIDLAGAGILPVSADARRPRRRITEGLFADGDTPS
ncbi:type ISP restriction/modification enzyme [Frankia sp. Cr1]|uniref:type ISP restriction/modification enzyme n=1 Tax=Frankia sp. Cr1 TaxID=3073931 RepID=UPI002AD4461A|nr:type ISP restriction/modification enzyme [Frankia sp. Cr1]